MLISLVTGGFHTSTKYQLHMGDTALEDEIHPVLYVTQRGDYICTCSTMNNLMKIELKFEVKG